MTSASVVIAVARQQVVAAEPDPEPPDALDPLPHPVATSTAARSRAADLTPEASRRILGVLLPPSLCALSPHNAGSVPPAVREQVCLRLSAPARVQIGRSGATA